jgi:hypothetical protein
VRFPALGLLLKIFDQIESHIIVDQQDRLDDKRRVDVAKRSVLQAKGSAEHGQSPWHPKMLIEFKKTYQPEVPARESLIRLRRECATGTASAFSSPWLAVENP